MEEEKPADFYKTNDIMGFEEPLPIRTSSNTKKSIEYNREQLPDLITRVKAVFVDAISILLLFTLTSWVVNNIGDLPAGIKGFIFVFMIYLYEPTLVTLTRGTIGHKFVNIQVVNYRNPNKRINFIQASLRFITKYFLGWVSFITVSFNKNKRAVHDTVGNSIVLYENASNKR